MPSTCVALHSYHPQLITVLGRNDGGCSPTDLECIKMMMMKIKLEWADVKHYTQYLLDCEPSYVPIPDSSASNFDLGMLKEFLNESTWSTL